MTFEKHTQNERMENKRTTNCLSEGCVHTAQPQSQPYDMANEIKFINYGISIIVLQQKEEEEKKTIEKCYYTDPFVNSLKPRLRVNASKQANKQINRSKFKNLKKIFAGSQPNIYLC